MNAHHSHPEVEDRSSRRIEFRPVDCPAGRVDNREFVTGLTLGELLEVSNAVHVEIGRVTAHIEVRGTLPRAMRNAATLERLATRLEVLREASKKIHRAMG